VAPRRRRPEPLHDVADNGARVTLSSTLSFQRPCLAGTLSLLSHPGGRAPADRPPLWRAQSAAGRAGRDTKGTVFEDRYHASSCENTGFLEPFYP
jgi:hypothetical protein